MPLLQAIGERANSIFSRENIQSVSFPQGRRLSDVARVLGIATSDAESRFLDTWPSSLQQCILSVLRDALDQKPPTPVTMCWVPDYDYSVSVWDAHATKGSARAITMILKSPYPG